MSIPGVVQHVVALPLIFLCTGAIVRAIGALIFAGDLGHWADAVKQGLS